jgi:uncharacterized protein (DUF2147 family)
MIKNILALILSVFSFAAIAQTTGDEAIGVWKNGEGTALVEIYKTTSGHYAGKIVWLKEPIDPETKKPKLDKRNPDEKKRSVALLGMINMKAFSFNKEDKIWENGTVYDPKNGKEYSCKMELENTNTLLVRGFIGISLIGRTDTWTRQTKKK